MTQTSGTDMPVNISVQPSVNAHQSPGGGKDGARTAVIEQTVKPGPNSGLSGKKDTEASVGMEGQSDTELDARSEDVTMDDVQVPLEERAFPDVTNEVRITSRGKVRNYVTYAANLFLTKNETSVVVRGLGNTIGKSANLAEVLKRRVSGLYQVTHLSSIKVTDTLQSSSGKPPRSRTQLVPVMSILLTTERPEGVQCYQTPLPDEEVKPLKKPVPRKAPRRKGTVGGRGRGESGEAGQGGRGGERGRGRGPKTGRGGRPRPAAEAPPPTAKPAES